MVCTAVTSYMLASRRVQRARNVFSAPGESELVEWKVEAGTAEPYQPERCVPDA